MGVASVVPYISSDWPPNAAKAAVPFYDETVEHYLATWSEPAGDDDAASAESMGEHAASALAEQGSSSKLTNATNGSLQSQSTARASPDVDSPQFRRGTADRQARNETPSESHRKWRHRRNSRRGEDSAYQRRSRDDDARVRTDRADDSYSRPGRSDENYATGDRDWYRRRAAGKDSSTRRTRSDDFRSNDTYVGRDRNESDPHGDRDRFARDERDRASRLQFGRREREHDQRGSESGSGLFGSFFWH